MVRDLGTYLGLPCFISRRKVDAFSAVKERIWKLVQGWRGNIFSFSGKEVLIKSIAQAIPTYAMSCFKLPKGFYKDVESFLSRFWWGTTENKRRLHWKSWEMLGRPKELGASTLGNLKPLTERLLLNKCGAS